MTRLLDTLGRNWCQLVPVLWRFESRFLPASEKPRIRISANGWIRHAPGPFPFPQKTVVHVVFENGQSMTDYADKVPSDRWRGIAGSWHWNVARYRIIRFPKRGSIRILGEGERA